MPPISLHIFAAVIRKDEDQDVAQLDVLESIALFLPTMLISVLELQDRTKPKVRRHRYSRHHLISLACAAWLFATAIAPFFVTDVDAQQVLFISPIMLVNYALLGTFDLLISPFRSDDDLREKPHIFFGRTFAGTPMPGLSGWNMQYESNPFLRIFLTLLFTFLVTAVNAALIYLMILKNTFVPLVGVVVGSVLTVTVTHPTAAQKTYPIQDSNEGLLMHSITSGERTRAFLISLREMDHQNKPVVKLFIFQDASTQYSRYNYWDQRSDENDLDRMVRLMPYSPHKDPLNDDHEGLIITARSLTTYLKDRYGSNEWAAGHLDEVLRKHILSGDVLRAVGKSTTGVEHDDNDLSWIAHDGVDLYAVYVLMHVHAMVEQRVTVALEMRSEEEDSLPYFVAAMQPKYYGSNNRTWEYQSGYSGSAKDWKLSNSKVQAPDCVRELEIIGTTPQNLFKTKTSQETSHMIEAYERMASQVDSCWVRLYAACLYLIRQGRIHGSRKWKGEMTQDLRRRVEDPPGMNKQLRSLILTQLGYSTVIAVKTWLPGRLAG